MMKRIEPSTPWMTTVAPGFQQIQTSSSAANRSILILYTTLYREGGAQFRKAAQTLAREKEQEFPALAVQARAVESKKEFLDVFAEISAAGGSIEELHFIGHSGVYGIMFGTRKWPEQFSPFEWKHMEIPFAQNARAYFHACRTGRWFAPFFARTFQVKSYGYHWYTTLSRSKDRFAWERKREETLHVISCTGKKSHGLMGSLSKHLGLARSYALTAFCPNSDRIDTTYDSVAELYDNTFEDIAVREDELRWLVNQLGDASEFRVLDIGCGNGAFLAKLAPGLREAVGVDISAKMLEQARKKNAPNKHLSFAQLNGPDLPFPDASFDRVISVLAYRYLDWDPIMKEIQRVLKPGGEFIVIDMVAAPTKLSEIPFFLRCKLKAYTQRIFHRGYFQALRKMVTDRRWQNMLKHNPIRSEHEMRWYLESRFPGRKGELINVGWSSRILAFRTGPIEKGKVVELTYP